MMQITETRFICKLVSEAFIFVYKRFFWYVLFLLCKFLSFVATGKSNEIVGETKFEEIESVDSGQTLLLYEFLGNSS